MYLKKPRYLHGPVFHILWGLFTTHPAMRGELTTIQGPWLLMAYIIVT